MEPVTDLILPKHRRLFVQRADVRRLARRLEAEPADVLHAHLDGAHASAARARRALARAIGLSARVRRPLVVRSLYDGAAPASSLRSRWLYGKEADGVFVFGESVRQALLSRFRLPEDRVVRLEGAVALDRFRPRAPGETLRERFGIPAESIVVGIASCPLAEQPRIAAAPELRPLPAE